MKIDQHALRKALAESGISNSAKWIFTSMIFECFDRYDRIGLITKQIEISVCEDRRLRSKALSELKAASLLVPHESGLYALNGYEIYICAHDRSASQTEFSIDAKCHPGVTQVSLYPTSFTRKNRQKISGKRSLEKDLSLGATPQRERERESAHARDRAGALPASARSREEDAQQAQEGGKKESLEEKRPSTHAGKMDVVKATLGAFEGTRPNFNKKAYI